jgi:hypothetical protein
MKLYREILSAMLIGLLVVGLMACEKEGTAEKAGKAIDEAASDVAEEAEEATEAIQDKMDNE